MGKSTIPGDSFGAPLDSVVAVRTRGGRRTSLQRPYWELWWANTASGIGDGVILAALPLLAAKLTGNALLVALVVVVQRLPWAVVAIPVGAYVDRHDPARAMIVADLTRGGVLAGISGLLVVGDLSILLLYAAALVVGVFDTV